MVFSRRAALGLFSAAAFVPGAVYAQDKPLILVLSHGADPQHRVITDAFKEGVTGVIKMSYDVGDGGAGAFIADNIRDIQVSLVFAVGVKALEAACREFSTVPVVYAGVADDSIAANRENVHGIRAALEPTDALESLDALLSPTTLGVLASSGVDKTWLDALVEAGEAVGLPVRVQQVAAAADLPNAMRVLTSSADAIWVQPDPGFWTGPTLSRVFLDGAMAKVPMVGFERSQLTANDPPVLALEADPTGVGVVASKVAASILETGAAAAAPHASAVVYGNRSAMIRMGVRVSKKSAGRVDHWVESP